MKCCKSHCAGCNSKIKRRSSAQKKMVVKGCFSGLKQEQALASARSEGSECAVHSTAPRGRLIAVPWEGRDLPTPFDVGCARLKYGIRPDGMAYLSVESYDVPATSDMVNCTVEWLDDFVKLDTSQQGFVAVYDFRNVAIPSMERVKQMATLSAESHRHSLFEKCMKECRIILEGGMNYCIIKALLTNFYTPACRTLVVTDPDQPEEEALIFDVCHPNEEIGLVTLTSKDGIDQDVSQEAQSKQEGRAQEERSMKTERSPSSRQRWIPPPCCGAIFGCLSGDNRDELPAEAELLPSLSRLWTMSDHCLTLPAIFFRQKAFAQVLQIAMPSMK
eukprot:gnl/TRDRNA2_/TRDRNA2_44371_c0_seq2.p1 gnl/TRDRNA2_/TRDRNA2_44371_c0~~gnl/TRDRNA2_/TRDRNA2_44371_c0_seq2.p1  ORF type:complete len:332 (+),score=55.72 gnl/TRDRNA2_/TRDRNA2_44371_c0_seq2:96-1091(+)